MADQSAKNSNEDFASTPADPVQELTWALLDENISDDEFEQLNRALLRDDKSRESYIGCIQLHADLMEHFRSGPRFGAKPSKGPAVLGLLGGELPLGFQSPSAEEATS